MTKELNPDMDYNEHYKTYDLFINMTKYGTIGMIIVLILMAIFLL